MQTITIPQNARLLSVQETGSRIIIEIQPTSDFITEALEKGFVKGATCKTYQGLRTIMSDRLGVDSKGNVFTRCPSPFFLRLGGKWVAEVFNK